ncbi:uncharacterized protein PAC_02553 [Phialocephala subalpina]|uniref:Ankyrin repeat protein n=1 Tax=Phialocephala subalpina TaxID=576137 RepID=A0A1L7WIT8_9HELO|nr:uncharacterized protein PAC_02553 [Phialocephala subalpina]
MDDEFKRKLSEMEDLGPDDDDDEDFEHMLKEMRESNRGKKLERVIHEEERIKQTRVNFASYPMKEQMMERLRLARKAWKEEVKEKREEYVKKIERQQEAGRHPKFPKRWSRDQKLDLELLERVKDWNVEDEPEDGTIKPKPENEYGFKACAIYFKKSDDGWQPDTHNHPKFKDGKFPNQKISVHDLIQPSSATYANPLSEPCGEDRLRYFHFPSNNMRWIEEAMARYYDEESGNHSDTQMPSKKSSRAEKLLSREYWRGQLHGGSGVAGNSIAGPVHARHMRSRCSLIPLGFADLRLTDTSSGAWTQRGRTPKAASFSKNPLAQSQKGKAKNFAIFLPYLHWETNSRRAKMAQVIKEVTKKLQAEKAKKEGRTTTIPPEEKQDKPERRCLPWRNRKAEEQLKKEIQESDEDDENGTEKKKGMFDVATKWKSAKNGKSLVRKKRCKLGRYLLALAQVADAMDYEADERLLRENLHHNPPLHIRRTLDQSYFLTLEDTSVRDKDQVVYRETREGRSFHTRNTRVVMVDQLWLWILDGNTIITSFPRRWGRNKPDPSGVHKSLRERLESTPEEEIQSVYDLALIIIDQCSRVFFDRTKPLDQRPEVMDLFASAIGSVTEHTTIAYESFWRNMEIRSMKIAQNSTSGSAKHSYLDINPEGTLLRESQDVAEELQIMLKIYNQQLHVVRDFRKILGHMNGESKNETDEVRTLIKLLRQNPILAGDRTQPTSQQEVTLPVPESTIQEANDLLELIRNRKAEIQDLEEAALRTTQQLQGLLSLKQQQASIIEAKAALARADESVKQGRAIMAFTIVTIFFLPLGFIAAFFGMNNKEINASPWMSLHQQMRWMFGVSTAVIVVSISIAFSPWTRATLTAFVKIPIIFVLEYTGLRALWKYYIVGHGYFEEKNRERIDWIHGHKKRVEGREAEAKKKAMEEDEYEWVTKKDQRATFKFVDIFLHGEKREAKKAKQRVSWKRPSLNGVNVGGMLGSGALKEEGEDIEKGHRTVLEDGE